MGTRKLSTALAKCQGTARQVRELTATRPVGSQLSAHAHEPDGAGDEQQVTVETRVPRVKKTLDKSWLVSNKQKLPSMKRPFPGVPPTKPLSELQRPETMLTTLKNGLRVASEETYGQLCSFGVLVDVGSCYETPATSGVNHLAEMMAFKSTSKRTHKQVLSSVEGMGGMLFCNSSPEQLLYCVDILRDNLEPAMEVLAECVLHPKLTDAEVEEAKVTMQLNSQDYPPEMLVREALQGAAYTGQPLGLPHYCPPERIPHLAASMLRDHREAYFLAPRMVLAGAGVQHDELVALGEKYFGGAALPAGDSRVITRPTSVFVGGEARIIRERREQVPDTTMVSVAFEAPSWHHDKMVATCVLQTLLGGGGSFSAGGPGKGMYSRLYREVLNKHFWVEHAEAIISINSDSGLLGMVGTSPPARAGEMLHVLCMQFAKLATKSVTEEELSRARNMLKCNVLTQLESRTVLFEDIGRQILTFGRRETAADVCAQIDAVTADDILWVAQNAFRKPPAVASVGADLSSVPAYSEVLKWFH